MYSCVYILYITGCTDATRCDKESLQENEWTSDGVNGRSEETDRKSLPSASPSPSCTFISSLTILKLVTFDMFLSFFFFAFFFLLNWPSERKYDFVIAASWKRDLEMSRGNRVLGSGAEVRRVVCRDVRFSEALNATRGKGNVEINEVRFFILCVCVYCTYANDS